MVVGVATVLVSETQVTNNMESLRRILLGSASKVLEKCPGGH